MSVEDVLLNDAKVTEVLIRSFVCPERGYTVVHEVGTVAA